MNPEDRERELQQWLDQALAHYSDVEPRTGLEQRILANLEAKRQARRPWWQWALVPAAAVIVTVVALSVLRTQPRTVQPTPPPTVTRAPETQKPVIKVVPKHQAGNQQVAMAAPPRVAMTPATLPPAQVVAVKEPPKQGVFPSPTPLSSQEVAAMHLVRRDPAEATYIAKEQASERERLNKDSGSNKGGQQ